MKNSWTVKHVKIELGTSVISCEGSVIMINFITAETTVMVRYECLITRAISIQLKETALKPK
jgi:hypothetical protein